MDTNRPTGMYSPPPPPPVSVSSAGMFGSKIPSSVAFAIGILLFLLPFAEIRCGGSKLAQKSGLDYALGNDWKPATGGMFGGTDMQKKSVTSGKEQEGNTRYFIIAALGLGVIGFAFSFASAKTGGSIGLVAGILSAGALIGYMLDLKKEFNKSLREQALDKAQEGADGLGIDQIGNTMNNIKPTLAFTPWFYIAIIAFLIAAIFCYRRMAARRY